MYRECPNCFEIHEEEYIDLGAPSIPECIIGIQICSVCDMEYKLDDHVRLSILSDPDYWKEFLK